MLAHTCGRLLTNRSIPRGNVLTSPHDSLLISIMPILSQRSRSLAMSGDVAALEELCQATKTYQPLSAFGEALEVIIHNMRPEIQISEGNLNVSNVKHRAWLHAVLLCFKALINGGDMLVFCHDIASENYMPSSLQSKIKRTWSTHI